MIDINNLVPKNVSDDTYKNSITHKYNEFIKDSEIPSMFKDHKINTNKLPNKLNTLSNNIYEIISQRYNIGIDLNNYSYTGFLTSLLLDNYYTNCIMDDQLLERVLYIDTNLLMDDFKKLMDKNSSENNPVLTHSLDTIYKKLENVPYVIWDKFTLLNSNFDKQKLYNILLIRYRKALGNIFYIKNVKQNFSQICDDEMYSVMNLTVTIDCKNEDITYLDDSGKGEYKW